MKPLLRLKILLAVSWLGMSIDSVAQVDVFGVPEPATPSLGQPVLSSAVGTSSSGLEDKHVVVRAMRRSPPQTEIELGRAVLYMTRIERWDEVGRYLDQLGKLPIDEAMALKIERAAGLETWFKLSGNSGKLSDQQRAVARKIIELSSGATRQPATLQNAIRLLYSKVLVDRKRGVLAIQASGETGLAAMLESVLNSDTPPAPILSEAIITMGSEGEAALKAALTAFDQKARERYLLIAARIPGAAYMPELTSSLYTIDPESETHRAISRVLSPAGQALPQAAASQRYVLNEMQSQLNEFTIFRRDVSSSANSIWRWSPDGKRLITEFDDAAGVHLERAYQLAKLVIQLKQQAAIDSALATAVILERHHRLSPVFELDPEALRKSFNPGESIEDLGFLNLVLESAKKAGLLAAELRSVQAMALALPKNPTNASATVLRLSETVKSAAPPIRYASAAALANRPDAIGGFEGKYAFDQTKLEMRRLESKALALVVGGSVELRDSLSKQLAELRIKTVGTSSARETLRLIQEPQPIEYIFLVDRVLEMSISELVQRIRAHPRTSALPLAILTDRVGPTQRAVLADEGTQQIHYSSVTNNIDLTGSLLSDMKQRSPIPRMDSIDRLLFQSLFDPPAN